MPKLYPSSSKRLSNRRITVLLFLAIIAIGWIIYSYLINDLRWDNYLLSATFIALLTGFNIADSMWPVVSFDDQVVTQHRTLWFPKQYRLEDVSGLGDHGQFLYINQPNRKAAIDLSRLNDADFAKIRRLTQEAK